MIQLYKSRWMKNSQFFVNGYQPNIMLNYNARNDADLVGPEAEKLLDNNMYAHIKGPSEDADAGGFRLTLFGETY
jgi:hypothetical protein